MSSGRKVFIGWSGDQSRMVAEPLRDWLPDVIQTIEPFVSSVDVPRGGRWGQVIDGVLVEANFAILCVTRSNCQSPWINYEAGALQSVPVVPFLLDMPVRDLTGPLSQFQAATSGNPDETFAMIKAIRDELKLSDLNDLRLRRTFEAFWPSLEKRLKAARNFGRGS